MGILKDKGRNLVLIIVVEFIITALSIIIIPNSFDISGNNEHLTAVAPFVFIFGLITPIIFITQFKGKQFYKYFGYFVLILNLVQLVTIFVYGSNLYLILLYGSYIISFLGLTGFVVYTRKRTNLQIANRYVIIYLVAYFFSTWLVKDYFTIQFSSISTLFVVVIPFILAIVAFIYKLVLVVYECKEQSKEDIELL